MNVAAAAAAANFIKEKVEVYNMAPDIAGNSDQWHELLLPLYLRFSPHNADHLHDILCKYTGGRKDVWRAFVKTHDLSQGDVLLTLGGAGIEVGRDEDRAAAMPRSSLNFS